MPNATVVRAIVTHLAAARLGRGTTLHGRTEMRSKRRKALVAACAGATALAVAAAAPAAPPLQNVECGSVITESTTLTRSLRDCAEGIVVSGTGITLDLGGHVIAGTGATGTGVLVSGDEVTIQNGRIREFAVGVGVAQPDDFVPGPTFHLRWLRIVRNETGVSAFNLRQIVSPSASTIVASEIERNAGRGISAFGYRLSVDHSSIRGNGAEGVHAFESPGTYEWNDISNNGGTGLLARDQPATLVGNRLNGNGGSGFELFNHVADALASSHLANNEAKRNAALGFFVLAFGNGLPWEGFDGGGNVARNNGDERQCVVETALVLPGGEPIPPEALTCQRRG